MKNKIISKFLSMLMSFMMIISIIPTNVFASQSEEVKVSQGIEITEEDLNANNYETYYYLQDKNYVYKGKSVEFISESQI